jgi:hypothetical protein
MASPPPGYGGPQYATGMQPATQMRRNSSNATSTSSNSGGGNVRRSSSNRASAASTAAPGYSYVMRLRAKVAVSWCDRGQAEDPRILAAMRAAKERAEREVALPPSGAHHHGSGARAGGAAGGIMGGAAATTQLQHQPDGGSSSFTSGVARKIRHHGGAPKASKYAGGNLVGAGVPMRLSANEVDDDDELPDDDAQQNRDDDWGVDASFYGSASQRFEDPPPLPQKVLQIHQHRRSDSGGRGAGSLGAHAGAPRLGLVVPPEDSPDESQSPEATPVASTFAQREYYYQQQQQQAAARQQQRHAAGGDAEERRREEELKRRGSVDDRAMTMSGVRLYVANPDVDD